MKALLGWEMGGGQGHIHRLAAISRLLTEHHIEPVLVLRNPNLKGIDLPWKVLQAPSPVLKTFDGQTNITSYLFTDLLYIFGFSEPLTLHFHLQAWQNVIDLVQPVLIFADFAPALVLAARGKVPTIVIGSDLAFFGQSVKKTKCQLPLKPPSTLRVFPLHSPRQSGYIKYKETLSTQNSLHHV